MTESGPVAAATIWTLVALVVAGAVGLFLVDRGLLALERRGWI